MNLIPLPKQNIFWFGIYRRYIISLFNYWYSWLEMFAFIPRRQFMWKVRLFSNLYSFDSSCCLFKVRHLTEDFLWEKRVGILVNFALSLSVSLSLSLSVCIFLPLSIYLYLSFSLYLSVSLFLSLQVPYYSAIWKKIFGIHLSSFL